MDLSIVIVNWNSQAFLRPCIDSIYSQTRDLQFEVIVIDSASFDGSDVLLEKHYPAVKFIQSKANLGFAKSNNHAFETCEGDIVLFLNPDTEILGSAINELYNAIISLPESGALGGRLLNSDGSVQTSCIKAFPTILTEVLGTEAFRRCFPSARLWGMAPLFSDNDAPSEVDVISGACLMVRREVFEKSGRFSVDYFMYSEDVDLCFKIRRSGFRNYYVPNATFIHHGGSSSAQSEVSMFSSIMKLEARWRYFCKVKSYFYGSIYRTSILMVSILRVFLALFLAFPAILVARESRWRLTLKKWWASLRWALGLERWVEKYGL